MPSFAATGTSIGTITSRMAISSIAHRPAAAEAGRGRAEKRQTAIIDERPVVKKTIQINRTNVSSLKRRNGAPSMPMPLIANIAVFQRKLAGFPIATYQAGEIVLSAASTTGRLLILRKGAVAVLREGVKIATVTEPGAVFGELSVLLDQPHMADIRALEASQFHVADAASLLRVDPIALLYVATVLARRLDDANVALIELRRGIQAGQPRSVIEKTFEKMEGLLGASGAHLVYARYPYDLFAHDLPDSKMP
jgi:CRP/FNR family transcriptional regulator, cyclic AMP receptor protein